MLFSTRTLDTALVRLSVNGMKQQNRDNLGTKKFMELQITSTIDSYFLSCVLQKEREICVYYFLISFFQLLMLMTHLSLPMDCLAQLLLMKIL